MVNGLYKMENDFSLPVVQIMSNHFHVSSYNIQMNERMQNIPNINLKAKSVILRFINFDILKTNWRKYLHWDVASVVLNT